MHLSLRHLVLPLAVALLAFAGGWVTAAPARAGQVPQGFFGLGGWSYPDDARAAELAGSGLRMFRAALAWDVVEPLPGNRHWGDADRLAERARRSGFDLLFVLNGCPVWACGASSTPPTAEPALSQYRQFVAAAVRRYGGNGSFWGGGPSPRVSWQVGNEVNGGEYFGKNPRPADYAAYLRAVGSTIKGVDPAATVVASGLVEKPGDSNGVFLDSFLRGLYAQPGFASAFDVAAVHGYAESPAGTMRVLDTMRRVMVEAGDGSRPLWVTEMSWSTGGPRHPFRVDEATQAAYLRSSWDTMLGCRTRWNLQKVMWFAHTDINPALIGEPDYWGAHNGLLRRDMSAKPAYHAFREYLAAELPGRADSCGLPGAAALDVYDPDTTITAAPDITNDVSGPTVSFASDEAGVRFECSLNGVEGWRACASPHPVASSREGRHWLRVRAIDQQGNTDPSPARAEWMLDLSAPSTSLTSRTPRTSGNSILKVGFTGADAVGVARFECRLDKGAWTPCTSPYQTPKLRPGWHYIDVRAIDKAGNVDPTPLNPSFKIDPSKPVLGQQKVRSACAARKTKVKRRAGRAAAKAATAKKAAGKRKGSTKKKPARCAKKKPKRKRK